MHVGGGRDQDPGPGLALAELVGRLDEQAVGSHADGLLGRRRLAEARAAARIGVGSAMRGRLPPHLRSRRMLRGVTDPPATVAPWRHSRTIWRRRRELADGLRRAGRGCRAFRPARTRSTLRAYFLLTKPRVIELLLVTTVPAMILGGRWAPGALADRGRAGRRRRWPPAGRTRSTAGSSATGTADAAHPRPPAAGRRHQPDRRAGLRARARGRGVRAALVDGRTCSRRALAVSATLFYVFVYTLWLKPRSTQNIVIGGAAGAVPGPRRLGRGHRVARRSGLAHVRDHLLLDPAALLGALDPVPGRLPARRASRCCRSCAASRLRPGRSCCTRSSSPAVSLRARAGLEPDAGATPPPPACSGSRSSCRRSASSATPRPQRAIKLFTFSNIYLALLFAAIAVDTLVRFA